MIFLDSRWKEMWQWGTMNRLTSGNLSSYKNEIVGEHSEKQKNNQSIC